MSSGWVDHTEPSLSTSLQGQQGMQGVVHLFGVVQAHRTSSNLLEPPHYKDSKLCRVLSQEFGVVRLYRTFSIFIVTEIARCAGCLCTSSGWFKHIEPLRTFSNHIITGIIRCVEFCHMSSGWFYSTEPSLSTLLQGQQGMQGVAYLFVVVQAHRTSSNLLEHSLRRSSSLLAQVFF